MNRLPLRLRTIGLLAFIIPLLALFIYVGLRSGPLAPIAVTLAEVEAREISPSLFGIGTVEARYSYRIGPTLPGRVLHVAVEVGDRVQAGALLGEMDPIDLDDRIHALESALRRAQAAIDEAEARRVFAQGQAKRYEELYATNLTSAESIAARRQELQIAEATLRVTNEELTRTRAELDGLMAQRESLRLVAPVAGLVVAREAESGTTVVAGQTVVELIDPESLWVNVRFDQVSATGLVPELPATVVLRSRDGQGLPGRVLRVEPKADAVTEETLAKIVFDSVPQQLPPLGELAEVTVALAALPAMPAIPNAAVQRLGNQTGVWTIVDEQLHFAPVTLGSRDLEGYVQVRSGLDAGERIVVYSEATLKPNSRIKVVEQLPGQPR